MIRDATHIAPAQAGAYPVRGGNAVVPLVDGDEAFRRICLAVEAAQQSVWITVAYLDRDVAMPDARGTFFDVLDAARARGIDVRVLFWREPRLPEIEPDSTHFPGNADERAFLAQRGSRFLARWDRHPGEYCHHQKSWLIDAGERGEAAFVGGINLLHSSSAASVGHADIGHEQDHDVYVGVRGPAATDVHHNFVQRWNAASERSADDGSWPDEHSADDLAFPARISAKAGDVPVQITRTLAPELYSGDEATPGGQRFRVAEGETSVLEQYLAAIGDAQQAIYIEDQAIASPVIIDGLSAALERGVAVFFLVPGNAHPAFVEGRRNPAAAFFFDKLAALAQHAHFTLAAIAGSRSAGAYDEVYVHAKIMLVDDAWATIGSTNVAERSFHRDTELNASFWHEPTVRALRTELLAEHLGEDTAGLGAREALERAQTLATLNAERRARSEPLSGLVYRLDPATYGA